MRRLAPFLLAAGLAAALVALACGTDSHVVSAERLDDTRGCLLTPESIDVLEGPNDPVPCDASCLVEPPARDGAASTFVTQECPPMPPLYDTSGTDPRCAVALAAFARGDYCLDDGGSTAPPRAIVDAGDAALPTGDAGGEADAAADASATQ